VDKRLALALENDAAPDVRASAIDALAARHAMAYVDKLRARQDDSDEAADVRVHAILALASLCDMSSVDDWAKLATGIRVPIDDGERRIQSASITALGQVHPADLAPRLASLLEKDTPAPVREVVKSALASAPTCAGHALSR
jgi:HEAT repeat protein